jgi:hypothetical protein
LASVTTRVAVFVPSVNGEKVTVTVHVPRGSSPTAQVVPVTENSGLAGVIAAAIAPVADPPPLATVTVTVFDFPVVAAVCGAAGEITSLDPVTTSAVIDVILVTLPALQMTWSPVFAPAVVELKVKPRKQLALFARAPAAAVGQVVVVGSGLMLPADETEQRRSVNAFVAMTVTFPAADAPTRSVPKSTWSV